MAKRKAEEISDETKRRCNVQTTMFRYFQSPTSSHQSSSPRPSIAMTPQAYGIHCYTDEEIAGAKGLQKTFRKFWNAKASELCSNREVRAKLQKKTAIQGAIYSSWALEKTLHLQLQAEEVQEEAKTMYVDEVARDRILTPITRNLERMLQAYALVNHLYEEMHSGGPSASNMEEALDKELTELRKAQDALQKAIKRRQFDLAVSERDQEDLMTTSSPVKISDDELEKLVKAVISEEQDCIDTHFSAAET